MWSWDNGRYDGKYYQLAETLCSPQPIQRPNPPVLLGGTGERKTLRLVAQYADSWNGSFQTVEEAAHKIDVLYRHCDAVGRDPGEIQKTAIMRTDPVAFASRLGELVIPRVAQIECRRKIARFGGAPARLMTVTSKDIAPAASRVSRRQRNRAGNLVATRAYGTGNDADYKRVHHTCALRRLPA
jgi:alkanesulfonate monooxygenase SsuD/methylene tetrahydromethanopterin reductase-like flavin-dependent oxidoreductase (luciferase family)